MFPGIQFRMAYDLLRTNLGIKRGNKEYLRILELTAKDNETLVHEILHYLINQEMELSFEAVQQIVKSRQKPPPPTQVNIDQIDLAVYDGLLEHQEVLV